MVTFLDCDIALGDDPCCSAYAPPRLPSSPCLQSHPMPWERLRSTWQPSSAPGPHISPPHVTLSSLVRLLGITCTGRRRGRRTRNVSSGAGYLSVRRFSSVQQFARLTTISYPASICVSCHHNGRQGPALWAVCQLVLGSWETPRYVSPWTNIVNIVFSSSTNAWC